MYTLGRPRLQADGTCCLYKVGQLWLPVKGPLSQKFQQEWRAGGLAVGTSIQAVESDTAPRRLRPPLPGGLRTNATEPSSLSFPV